MCQHRSCFWGQIVAHYRTEQLNQITTLKKDINPSAFRPSCCQVDLSRTNQQIKKVSLWYVTVETKSACGLSCRNSLFHKAVLFCSGGFMLSWQKKQKRHALLTIGNDLR